MALVLVLGGCQSVKPKTKENLNLSALTTVTTGLTHQSTTQDQVKKLAAQLKDNPRLTSTLREIKDALSARHTVKYCPENGERFSADMVYCPDGKVKLEWVE